jgi:hypothetical protein
MLPVPDSGDGPDRLELFAVLGPPSAARLLRARHEFRDFDAPYRHTRASPASRQRGMR